MSPYYKTSPKGGYIQANIPPHPVTLQSPESLASPYQYQPVYYENQPHPSYQVQYKFVPYQQQEHQDQHQQHHQHHQGQPHFYNQPLQNSKLYQMPGNYLQLPPLGQLQASPIIHRSQVLVTPTHSHNSSGNTSYTTDLPQLQMMSSTYHLPYQTTSSRYLPPKLTMPPQGHAQLGGRQQGQAGQAATRLQPISPDQPKPSSSKRHKKSKSFPESKYYDSLVRRKSTSGSSSSPSGSSSSSNSTRKSHHAEAPASKDVRFPIWPSKNLEILDSLARAKLNHIYNHIEVKKYSTSAIDPLRNHLTVYEYVLNKHWVIWDYETGFVHLTGIWKASISGSETSSLNGSNVSDHPKSHFKADIVKLLETTPKEYQQHIKRIRGGFLKIQGTWLPYDLCKIVARKFCYHIRFELIPIFGEDFPGSCLSPDDPGFGKLRLDESFDSKDRKRRSNSLVGQDKSKVSVVPKKEQQAGNSTPKVTIPTIGTFHSIETSPLSQALPYSYSNVGHPASASAAEVSGPRSSESSMNDIFSSNTSYHDMLDIVTASKCLQSLRSGGQQHKLQISYTTERSRCESNKDPIHLPEIGSTSCSGTGNSSTLTSPLSRTSLTLPTPVPLGGGISTILKAANLRENDKEEEREQVQDRDKRRISLKIHDLIS